MENRPAAGFAKGGYVAAAGENKQSISDKNIEEAQNKMAKPQLVPAIESKTTKHYGNVRQMNQALFRSKEQARKLWAKETIEDKIRELIKMQKITSTLHPKYAKILPWRIHPERIHRERIKI